MPEIIKETAEKKVAVDKSRNKTWFKKEFSASTLLFGLRVQWQLTIDLLE